MRPQILMLVFSVSGLFPASSAVSQCLLNGVYASSPSVVYSCAFGLVTLNIQTWTVTVTGAQINIVPSSATFGTMTGTIDCQTGAFTAMHVIPGGASACTETYTLTGQVQSTASWTGMLQAQYTGPNCFDCGSRMWGVSGALPPTGVGAGAPPAFAWMDVGPNPLTSNTTLRVHLDSRQFARLVVRDITGREVAVIVDGDWLERGDYDYTWDARTREGRRAPTGIYFVHLRTDAVERAARLLVLN